MISRTSTEERRDASGKERNVQEIIAVLHDKGPDLKFKSKTSRIINQVYVSARAMEVAHRTYVTVSWVGTTFLHLELQRKSSKIC
jgi:hypothetical protein